LFEQFPEILSQSHQATQATYQQLLQNSSGGHVNFDHAHATTISIQANGTDLFSTISNNDACESIEGMDMTNEQFLASYTTDINPLLAHWGSTTTSQGIPSNSEGAFRAKSACTCINFCTCPVPRNNQLQSPAPSTDLAVISESLDKDSKLMGILQSMNKSIIALERKLESRNSPN
jgi:hypothetical protein